MKLCVWGCGRETTNKSGIDNLCWRDREAIYQARKAMEAQAEKKPRTANQQAATDKLIATKRAKLTKELPTSES
jgi:hypothetical protein